MCWGSRFGGQMPRERGKEPAPAGRKASVGGGEGESMSWASLPIRSDPGHLLSSVRVVGRWYLLSVFSLQWLLSYSLT